MEDTEESSTDSDESYEDDYSDYDYSCHGGGSSPKRIKTYPYAPVKQRIQTTVPELKDTASAVVAISLWNHLNIPGALSEVKDDCTKETALWKSLKNDVCKLSSELPVPNSMAEQINKFIGEVHKEIGKWATYHFRAIFFNMVKDNTVYNHVYDIVWRSDGSIDCIETAKKISKSKSPRLSDTEKFRFLCTYCLKHEMQQVSPVLFSNIFRDYVPFDQHPLIYYWHCYFSNELNLIPKNEHESVDCSMFRHRFVDNWPAKEYFFERLSSDEQVQNAIWLIDESGVLYQKPLLMKLNESQRIGVYMARPQRILTNYIRQDENSKDVLETWFEILHFITPKQFVHIFAVLLEVDITGDASGLMTTIWTSADAHLKLYLSSYNNYAFIKKIMTSTWEWVCDPNFVLTVLQDLNEETKNYIVANENDYIMEFCESLFINERDYVPLLNRLSNLLFIDAEKSSLFKRNVVFNCQSIADHCLEYYSTGDVKGLDHLLAGLLVEWPDLIPRFKKQILESQNGMRMCAKLLISETNVLSEVVVDAMGTADLEMEFIIKELFNNWSTHFKLKNLLLNNGLNDVKKIVDRFLTSDEDKENLKKHIFDEKTELMCNIFIKCGEVYFQSVLQWRISPKESTMKKELRALIPLKEMFNKILSKTVDGYFYSKSNFFNSAYLDLSDRFLNWYFDSPKGVKKYKLKRIQSYSNVYPVKHLLRKTKYDKEPAKTLIKWFFENDKVEMEKFKKKCKEGKMRRIMEEI